MPAPGHSDELAPPPAAHILALLPRPHRRERGALQPPARPRTEAPAAAPAPTKVSPPAIPARRKPEQKQPTAPPSAPHVAAAVSEGVPPQPEPQPKRADVADRDAEAGSDDDHGGDDDAATLEALADLDDDDDDDDVEAEEADYGNRPSDDRAGAGGKPLPGPSTPGEHASARSLLADPSALSTFMGGKREHPQPVAKTLPSQALTEPEPEPEPKSAAADATAGWTAEEIAMLEERVLEVGVSYESLTDDDQTEST